MSLRSHQFRKPSVYVSESEFDRLADLSQGRETPGAALLGDELVRAIVLKESEFPRAYVRLHSVVDYTDLMTGRSRGVRIVPPEDAGASEGRLSVLEPVGAALLGLTAGDSIGLAGGDGRPLVLQVDAVESGRRARDRASRGDGLPAGG